MSMELKKPLAGIEFSQADQACMRMALDEARLAAAAGDVPVGAVLVAPSDGTPRVIGTGHNTREASGTVIGHAEINALSAACEASGSWRLSGCTLYVTLEPCPMCAGAILASRVGRVVYGCADPAAGAMGSVWALHRHPHSAPGLRVEGGCLADESRALLSAFFRERRRPDDTPGTGNGSQ